MVAREQESHPKKFTDGIRPRARRTAMGLASPVHHDDGRLLPGSMLERQDAPMRLDDDPATGAEAKHSPAVEFHAVSPMPPAIKELPTASSPKEKMSETRASGMLERASPVKKTQDGAPENKLGIPHKEDAGYPLEDKRFSWLARPKFSDQVASQKHFASLGPKKNRRGRWLLRIVLVGMLVLAGGVTLLSTVFARVTVAVKPRVDDVVVPGVPAVFAITAHAVLADQHLVPAERLEITKKISGEFPATGRANVFERARGRAILTNRYSSLPQPLVATTRFLTDAGALYRLPKAVIIPGAKIEKGALVPQSIEVELVADAPGEGGNHTGMPIMTIPGLRGTPKYDGFFATAPEGFAGGRSGAASVVTADDLKQAQDALSKKVIGELGAEIQTKIPAGFIAPDTLRELKVIQITAPAVQSASDRFSVTVEARARILAVMPDDVASLIETSLAEGGEGRKTVDKSSPLIYDATVVDFEKGRAEVVLRGSAKMVRDVDTHALREALIGKSQEAARAVLLAREEISAFQISFFPPWRYTIPAARNRVSVVLE